MKTDKQSRLLRCPNCGEPVSKPSEGCVLHALVEVIRGRGTFSERKLRTLHATIDVDFVWSNHIGPLVDRIESGDFCTPIPKLTKGN